MTKKRLLLIASLPLTIAVILGVLAMLPPRPGGLKAKFDRIDIGMTKDELLVIFGPPHHVTKGAGAMTYGGRSTYSWRHEGQDVSVAFGVNERKEIKEWFDAEETVLDKIRR